MVGVRQITKLTPAQSKALATLTEAYGAAGKPVHSDACGVSRDMAQKLAKAGLLTEHIRTVGMEGGFRVMGSFWSVTP